MNQLTLLQEYKQEKEREETEKTYFCHVCFADDPKAPNQSTEEDLKRFRYHGSEAMRRHIKRAHRRIYEIMFMSDSLEKTDKGGTPDD